MITVTTVAGIYLQIHKQIGQSSNATLFTTAGTQGSL